LLAIGSDFCSLQANISVDFNLHIGNNPKQS
jgi:hypothetical protein